jgi:hypothetical protein
VRVLNETQQGQRQLIDAVLSLKDELCQQQQTFLDSLKQILSGLKSLKINVPPAQITLPDRKRRLKIKHSDGTESTLVEE